VKKFSRVLCAILFFSCSVQATEGILHLTTLPQEATVYVDGQIRANATPIDLKLLPGRYQIEVKKPGKQTATFSVVIDDNIRINKEITLVDVPTSLSSEEKEINLLKILNPLRGHFETLPEFQERRRHLLENFNQAVHQHYPTYQAGVATFDKDLYDPVHGTLPVSIQWQDWPKKFSLPDKSYIALLPPQFELFWKEGLQKPVFLYFDMVNNEVVQDKTVLIGLGREWIMDDVIGYLTMGGSEELAALLTKWMERYQSLYSRVTFETLLKKTSAIPVALTEGTIQVAWMTREMTDTEQEQFLQKWDYAPLSLRVAFDAIAIYVHQDNPLSSLTIPQVDAIFSTTRKCEFADNLTQWGKLDLQPSTLKLIKRTVKDWLGLSKPETASASPSIDWDSLAIQLAGLNSASGVPYQFFKEQALCGGEFKKTINEYDSSMGVVKSVSEAVNRIGFATLGYEEEVLGVKAVAIKNPDLSFFAKPLSNLIKPTSDEAINGNYPLTHSIWLYLNTAPNRPLAPVVNKLVKMVLSNKGQDIVNQAGFIPLTPDLIAEQLNKLIIIP